MFIGRNMRTRIDLIEPHDTLEVNSKPNESNLSSYTLFPIDHIIVRRYGSKQKLQQEKIVERISCNMYKALINLKVKDKHIDPIKKSQTTEISDRKDEIWDNTIPLPEPTLNNSPRKRYPTRKLKLVIRYGFIEK